jgi:hypothetical protein
MAHPRTAALVRRLWLGGCAVLLGTAASAQDGATPGWLERVHASAAVEAGYTENISRTSHEPTRKDAATAEVVVDGAIPWQLAPGLQLTGTLEATGWWVDKYELANHVTGTARLALRKKFGLGPLAWVLEGSAGGGYKAARYGGDEGCSTEAGLSLSKRVLTTLQFSGSLDWTEHNAKSATFDTNQLSFTFDAQWDFAERWTLSGSAGWLQGDIVANAAWPVWAQALSGGFGPAIQNYYGSRPWEVTHIYGPNWVSYNVEADVDLWSLALAYSWNDRTALELGYHSAYVVNEVNVAYPTNSWTLRLSHRF